MNSAARVRTVPAFSGFMRSVVRRRNVDDFDEGIVISDPPEKKGSLSTAYLPPPDDLA